MACKSPRLIQQGPRHARAGAVADAVAAVDHEAALLLEGDELADRGLLAAHGEHDVFRDVGRAELLLAVDRHLAAAAAQLVGGGVEDRRVVAYVVG